jgi:hypothetical protein
VVRASRVVRASPKQKGHRHLKSIAMLAVQFGDKCLQPCTKGKMQGYLLAVQVCRSMYLRVQALARSAHGFSGTMHLFTAATV